MAYIGFEAAQGSGGVTPVGGGTGGVTFGTGSELPIINIGPIPEAKPNTYIFKEPNTRQLLYVNLLYAIQSNTSANKTTSATTVINTVYKPFIEVALDLIRKTQTGVGQQIVINKDKQTYLSLLNDVKQKYTANKNWVKNTDTYYKELVKLNNSTIYVTSQQKQDEAIRIVGLWISQMIDPNYINNQVVNAYYFPLTGNQLETAILNVEGATSEGSRPSDADVVIDTPVDTPLDKPGSEINTKNYLPLIGIAALAAFLIFKK